ncbi:phospholipase D family protein [Dyella agri]|uniref:Phospholipase D family protein n=1 Tax=Dyella agri TaxID=1926869 RepID=A0ABW8KG30_9GAMM
MRFFGNGLNGAYLRDVLPQDGSEVEWVKAAIAYGSDEKTLVQNCLELGKRLDIWMRYDHTVPVSPALLNHLLRSEQRNIFCKLVPDVLHAKVIWWRGYGAYIGSANLTDRAWMTNIEFGVFLSEVELEAARAIGELEVFFGALESCDELVELTEDLIKEQAAIQRARQKLEAEAESKSRAMRSRGVWGGPAFVGGRRAAVDRQREAFIKEWRNGASILAHLAEQAPSFRPIWLNEDVPPAWQADQFLHAYYYNQVVDGPAHPFEDFYKKNFGSPSSAVKAAFQWWSELRSPPSEEDVNCHERAPVIRRLLAPSTIEALTEAELHELLQANHSSRDHIRRMTLEELRVDPSAGGSVDRIQAFARLLYRQRNSAGQSFPEVLEFVLDGGAPEDMPLRLFEAAGERGFAHVGKNQLAEMAGWARPEKYSPRNGRTSKALRALGFNVKVY